jgi:hypothetical protein
MWKKLVKKVLKQDPESSIKKESPNPGPINEIEFWNKRNHNLT